MWAEHGGEAGAGVEGRPLPHSCTESRGAFPAVLMRAVRLGIGPPLGMRVVRRMPTACRVAIDLVILRIVS